MGAKKPVDKSVTEEQLKEQTKSSKTTKTKKAAKTSQAGKGKEDAGKSTKKKAATKAVKAESKKAETKTEKSAKKPKQATTKKETQETEVTSKEKEAESKEKNSKKKAGPKKAKAQEEAVKEEVKDQAEKTTNKAKTKADETGKSKDESQEETDEATAPKKAVAKPKKPKKTRSKKYQVVRSKVDRTRSYEPTAAVELVKKLSYTKFVGTITAHLTVREVGLSKEVALPHATGQARRVEIASDSTLAKIEQGQIDFDVLLATPQFMSKLTKFAPVLGPKGLMPNPKNGTLTTNPEKRQKELQAGSMVLKTERKAPLVHVAIGKTDMETSELVENLQVLFKAFKGKLKKVTIAATMSPGVKVEWEE